MKMEYDAWELGNRIREIRRKHKDTQEKLAEKAGISVDTVKRLEWGRPAKLETVMTIAEIYQVSLDYVVFGLRDGHLPLKAV